MENTENRTQAQILADNLGYRKTNFYEAADEAAIRAAYDYAPGYMKFLDEAKPSARHRALQSPWRKRTVMFRILSA